MDTNEDQYEDQEKKTTKADRVIDRITRAIDQVLDCDEERLLHVDAACAGLEELCELAGAQSLAVLRLRKSLEKRGLRRR